MLTFWIFLHGYVFRISLGLSVLPSKLSSTILSNTSFLFPLSYFSNNFFGFLIIPFLWIAYYPSAIASHLFGSTICKLFLFSSAYCILFFFFLLNSFFLFIFLSIFPSETLLNYLVSYASLFIFKTVSKNEWKFLESGWNSSGWLTGNGNAVERFRDVSISSLVIFLMEVLAHLLKRLCMHMSVSAGRQGVSP